MAKKLYMALTNILKRLAPSSRAYWWAYKHAMKAYMDAEGDPIIGYFKFSRDYISA